MSDPEMTTFNDLTSLKYKTTVGPIESAMREQRIQDGDLMNVMSQEVIDMEAFLGSGKPVVPSTAGDIRALKHRIHELEGELLGYKKSWLTKTHCWSNKQPASLTYKHTLKTLMEKNDEQFNHCWRIV